MTAIERAAEAVAATDDAIYLDGARVLAYAALAAALDVDELAGVIADHRMLPALGGTATGAWVDCSCGERITGWTRDHAQAQADRHLARALKEHLTKGTNDE